ncbi:MAG: glycosyltransferase, partial [Candidatus Aenigmarchaeota archaeon]|nr:glycosyltransferase [Candidatus Aenigmarchaeota archaeon]
MLLLKDLLFWAMYFISFYMSVFIILTLFERKIRKNPAQSGALPFVSVLVPAYNEGKTISSTLNSLLALDYPKEKLEIVVINDGSTDSTKKIVEDIYTKQGVVLINQKNKGKAAAMNNG